MPEEKGPSFAQYLHGLQGNVLSTDAVPCFVNNTVRSFTNFCSSFIPFHAVNFAGKEAGRVVLPKDQKDRPNLPAWGSRAGSLRKTHSILQSHGGTLSFQLSHGHVSRPFSHILVQSTQIRRLFAISVAEMHVVSQLPELGMSQFEVLSRASAFAVTLPSRPPVLLSSRHVTHPHHYLDTYYHDKEWLGAVNNRSLRYSVEAYKVQAGLSR
jgi:hypothetical protein